ncbi:MiaB/RimO family radical SAM methylthiotransferase, partial [Patescibacteria group bacterium]|nr:MiaB/RimO family radical SAM methylthiotransferase [Patescibacteria group bacterium]
MNRQYYILTYGCQMNKNDSERIAGLLNSLGMKAVDKPEMADLLIINTCSVRQSAEDRVFGMIKNWQELRKNRPNLLIAITGCMPGRDKNGSVRKKIAGVDLFFAIEELPLLPNWLGELGFEGGGGYTELSPARFCQHKAFVTIQTGCDNFCTYCVVPYSRGREKNRRVAEILNETRKAVSEGAKEVVLLGQVVNHYIAPDPENFSKKNIFKAKDDFSALLWEINQLDGVERINWTAPDPQYFNDYQVEALKLSKQMNYLHLPVQSGDNEILKKMNRHYTREQYIDLVKKIRAVRPDVAIGTDIIVGFCGETEGQFQNT